MRKLLLVAAVVALSAVPAVAGPINVGSFYFTSGVCDVVADPGCNPDFQFEYFTLDNNGGLPGLTFTGVIQVGGTDYVDQFFHSLELASGESVSTLGLPSSSPFIGGGTASLIFTGNYASLGGTLSLSNFLFDDLDPSGDYSPSFTADVQFTEDGPATVTETPSWLVIAFGLSALAVGRAMLR